MPRVSHRISASVLALSMWLIVVAVVEAADPSPVYLADAMAGQITSTCGEMGVNASCADRTVPLRIKDQLYSNGLSHRAGDDSSLFVPLVGKYETFEAEIGVQWQGGKAWASVEFQVYADDRLVFQSGIIRENDPPRKISISVKDAEMMQLVATAGGDGDNGDLADWANARLVPDPSPTPQTSETPVNIATFARVVTYDSKRMTGTSASRVQEFPSADVSLDTDLNSAADGSHLIPVAANGDGCIGLRWYEPRFLRRLELHWSEGTTVPSSDSVQLQYWFRLPFSSPWQGEWKPLPATVDASGRVWRWQITAKDLPLGTFRVRWVFTALKDPQSVESLVAFSHSTWTTADLRLEFQNVADGKAAEVGVYNGTILEPAVDSRHKDVAWSLSQPLSLQVRYSRPRARKDDRTLLRFDLPGKTISVAVEDVVEHGCVYVPSVGVFVSRSDLGKTLPQYVKEIAGRRTVLEQVRDLPDQSFAQAMAKTHNPIQNLGPTMVSLACDNRKFVVHRDGRIQFDVYDAPDGDYNTMQFWELVDPKRTSPQLLPQFGSGQGTIERYLDGGWLPKPVTTVTENGVKYRQRTYVAPVDREAPEGCPVWYRPKALCVVEYSIENTLATPADVALKLTLLKDCEDVTAKGLREVKEGLLSVHDGRVLAFFDAGLSKPLRLDGQTAAVGLMGKLAAGQSARLTVYLPAWRLAPDEYAMLSDASPWSDLTDRYWNEVMAGAAQITVPDEPLMNVIRASQVHCLIAARNSSRGNDIVPWASSVWYGAAVESEAQSIVRGMDMLGHADFARSALQGYLDSYNPEGFLTRGFTTVGTGWNLWTLAECQQRSGDSGWLRDHATTLVQACKWISRQRGKTKRLDVEGNRVPEYGLMPPCVTADWGRYSYKFFDNIQYCHGLETIARVLSDIGHPDAPVLLAEAKEYRADLLRAYRWTQGRSPVVPLQNGVWVQNHPAMLDVFGNVEEMYPVEDIVRTWCYSVELGSHHLAANRLLDPASEEVAEMMNYLEDRQFLRSGWYDYPADRIQKDVFNLGGFAKVQPYYCRNTEIYAMRDNARPFLRSYFNMLCSLLSEENLSLWEHFNNTSAWNKTHETGWFLCQTATMFAMERDDDLWLAPMTPRCWLKDGERIEVRNAPTRFGKVSYTLRSDVAHGRITAEIDPPSRQPPKHLVLRIRHPDDKPIQRVTVNGSPCKDFDPAQQCVILPSTEERICVVIEYLVP